MTGVLEGRPALVVQGQAQPGPARMAAASFHPVGMLNAAGQQLAGVFGEGEYDPLNIFYNPLVPEPFPVLTQSATAQNGISYPQSLIYYTSDTYLLFSGASPAL